MQKKIINYPEKNFNLIPTSHQYTAEGIKLILQSSTMKQADWLGSLKDIATKVNQLNGLDELPVLNLELPNQLDNQHLLEQALSKYKGEDLIYLMIYSPITEMNHINGYKHTIIIAQKDAILSNDAINSGVGLASKTADILFKLDILIELNNDNAKVKVDKIALNDSLQGHNIVSKAFSNYANFLIEQFPGQQVSGEFAHKNALHLFKKHFENTVTTGPEEPKWENTSNTRGYGTIPDHQTLVLDTNPKIDTDLLAEKFYTKLKVYNELKIDQAAFFDQESPQSKLRRTSIDIYISTILDKNKLKSTYSDLLIKAYNLYTPAYFIALRKHMETETPENARILANEDAISKIKETINKNTIQISTFDKLQSFISLFKK